MGCILAIAKDSMHANMIAQKKFGFHKNHLELFFSLSCSNISWVFGPSTEKEKAAIIVTQFLSNAKELRLPKNIFESSCEAMLKEGDLKNTQPITTIRKVDAQPIEFHKKLSFL